MSQLFKEHKNMILGGFLVIAGAFVYFNFFSGGGGGEAVVTTSGEANSPISQELLITLTTLNIITLDDSVFKDPAFISLSDFGVQIPTEPVGRRNPFAPPGQ